MKESILIISSDPVVGNRVLSEIAPTGLLNLHTKYYSVSVPVKMTPQCPDTLDPSVKAVIVIEVGLNDSLRTIKSLSSAGDDDNVRIYFAKDEIQLGSCIDHGFELVTGLGEENNCSNVDAGIGRIMEALKCRIWQTDEPSTCSSEPPEENTEQLLSSFESLISEMQQVRNASASLSDEERRARAECVASQLAKLLCEDSDQEDFTVE